MADMRRTLISFVALAFVTTSVDASAACGGGRSTPEGIARLKTDMTVLEAFSALGVLYVHQELHTAVVRNPYYCVCKAYPNDYVYLTFLWTDKGRLLASWQIIKKDRALKMEKVDKAWRQNFLESERRVLKGIRDIESEYNEKRAK